MQNMLSPSPPVSLGRIATGGWGKQQKENLLLLFSQPAVSKDQKRDRPGAAVRRMHRPALSWVRLIIKKYSAFTIRDQDNNGAAANGAAQPGTTIHASRRVFKQAIKIIHLVK